MTALSAVMALFLATLYAPLVHVHTHSGETVLIHAHLPELNTEDESVVHMESFHSHADARSLDILTTTAPRSSHIVAIIANAAPVADAVFSCCSYIAAAAPTAHGPPDFEFQIPRAPPA
jgi:hypothetical protein